MRKFTFPVFGIAVLLTAFFTLTTCKKDVDLEKAEQVHSTEGNLPLTFKGSLEDSIRFAQAILMKTKADTLVNSFQLDSAIQLLDEASKTFISLNQYEDYVHCQNTWCLLLWNTGQMSEAKSLISEVLQFSASCLPPINFEVSTVYMNIGSIAANEGVFEEAIYNLNKALNIRLALFGENNAGSCKLLRTAWHSSLSEKRP
ncbi:MAG: tetratricopeptide repeat protein [Saprospiraceae bacterium]|nr:tetratricopeptide repeat protein [Saprospiraceae bacterium]